MIISQIVETKNKNAHSVYTVAYFILLVRNFPWVSKAGSILGHSSTHCGEIIFWTKTKILQVTNSWKWYVNSVTNSLLEICSSQENLENMWVPHVTYHLRCCCRLHRAPWWLQCAQQWQSYKLCWSGQTSLLHPGRSPQTQSRQANEHSLLYRVKNFNFASKKQRKLTSKCMCIKHTVGHKVWTHFDQMRKKS